MAMCFDERRAEFGGLLVAVFYDIDDYSRSYCVSCDAIICLSFIMGTSLREPFMSGRRRVTILWPDTPGMWNVKAPPPLALTWRSPCGLPTEDEATAASRLTGPFIPDLCARCGLLPSSARSGCGF